MMKIPSTAMRRAGLAAGSIALALALAACGKQDEAAKPEATAAAGASQLTPLHVGTTKIAALANLYAARKLGYFQKQGLDVEFTEMSGGAELLPAVTAGKIDITLSIPSSPIQATEKGFDFAMVMQNEVAATSGQDSQAIFVNTDSGITKLSELKGKTAAINTIKSQMWLSFIEAAKKDGVGADDVNFVELPMPTMQDSLANKQVDAVLDVEPYTSRMLADKKFRLISYPATESLPGQTIGAFWASRKWLDGHADTARKFVTAMHEATEYMKTHPDETHQLIAEYTGLKLETIQAMHPVLWDNKVDMQTLQALIDMMKRNGVIQGDIKAESVVYATALE
jgi:NitT/TauT family transport system substrate-binding protein